MSGSRGLLIAVVALRDGATLEETARAFAPAGPIVVLDPLARLGTTSRSSVGAVAAPSVLDGHPIFVAFEGERPSAALVEALAAPGDDERRGVIVRHRGRGWCLEPRRPEPRYGPWPALRRVLAPGGTRAVATAGTLPGRLDCDYGGIEQAIVRLDDVTAAAVALGDDPGVRLGPVRAAGAAAARWGSALAARGEGSSAWGRWIGASLLAYREILAFTKALERRGRA